MYIGREVEPYEYQNRLIFTIDGDGDNYLTFNHCVKFIQENFKIETVEYYPGGWNTSKFVFIHLDEQITLLFNDFGGTDLSMKNNITKQKVDKLKSLVSSLINNLSGRILTK